MSVRWTLMVLSAVLAVVCVFMICDADGSDADPAPNQCGEDLYWSMSGGCVTFTGSGDMWNYAPGDVRGWKDCSSVILSDELTKIGEYAFFDCTSLASVAIPDSVTSIGNGTFDSCTSLASVTIGNSVTSIGIGAFNSCTSLASVIIPDSVTSIGDYAFSWCKSLTSVTLPDSVTSIRGHAFHGCASLTSVTLGNSVTSIGDDAFNGCNSLFEVINLSSLPITKGSSSNGYVAFNAMNVFTSADDATVGILDGKFFYGKSGGVNYLIRYIGSEPSVILPDTVYGGDYELYRFAFHGCTSMTSVTIPDSVTSIGEYAFSGCKSLTSVTIPDSVTSIGDDAFSWCKSLTSVTIPDSVTIIRLGVFSECTSLTSVTIPDSVTSIGYEAFRGCTSLTSVTIPDSVTSFGDVAFNGCSGLKELTIPISLNAVESNYSPAFDGCTGIQTVHFTKGTGVGYNYGSYSTSSYSNYYGYTPWYLSKSSLTQITFEDGITSIGDQAFYECTSLTSVTIPDSVTSIRNQAFYGCTNLSTVVNHSALPITKGSTEYGYVAYYADKVITGDENPSSGDSGSNGMCSIVIAAAIALICSGVAVPFITRFRP